MSKLEFKLPDIGEGVTEGEIVGWLVKAGDVVGEDQEMVEVMTDKATVTIGAPKAGTVMEVRGSVGDVVPVGDILVVLDTAASGAGFSAAATPETKAPEAAASPTESAASAVGDIKESLPGMGASAPPAEPAAGQIVSDKPLAAPATRKLARELGIDLRTVQPSGSAGRVTREDVERHANSTGTTASAPRTAAPRPAPPVQSNQADERRKIRGLRKRIFENMARSKHTAAHFTYVEDCECSKLKELRSRLTPHAQEAGIKLNFLPFIIKAVVVALKKHPELNCVVDDANQEVVLKGSFDIGIAAATDAGLIVPVLRHADRLSVIEIAKEVERLATDAREGRSRQEDMGGSSFTITSLGKIGGLLATPVVNYPEVAILFVPEMKKKPVVKGDEIVVGHVMSLSLSFDHRVIDGHVGAAFAQTIVRLLEEPDRLFVELA